MDISPTTTRIIEALAIDMIAGREPQDGPLDLLPYEIVPETPRAAPPPCGICDGDHSTVICQMSGAAPRPRPKLSLFKR